MNITEEVIISRYGLVVNKKILAEILDISQASISRLISSSQITYVKNGNGAVKFTAKAIAEYLNRNTVYSYKGE